MKYTKPSALAITALAITTLSACGAGKMPEDPKEALTWAVENYTSGNSIDVAKSIPSADSEGSQYVTAIGNGYVNEKSKCKVDPDSVAVNEDPAVVYADVWCEEALPKGKSLEGDPSAYFHVNDDGSFSDLLFDDTYIDEVSPAQPDSPGYSGDS